MISNGEAAKSDNPKFNELPKTQGEIWELGMETFDSVLAFGEHV
jgi:hypothetical protein